MNIHDIPRPWTVLKISLDFFPAWCKAITAARCYSAPCTTLKNSMNAYSILRTTVFIMFSIEKPIFLQCYPSRNTKILNVSTAHQTFVTELMARPCIQVGKNLKNLHKSAQLATLMRGKLKVLCVSLCFDVVFIFCIPVSGTLITMACRWWAPLLRMWGDKNLHISDFWLLSTYLFSIINLWNFPVSKFLYPIMWLIILTWYDNAVACNEIQNVAIVRSGVHIFKKLIQ